jgi:competence ComEA-like helix-hairpin-helix protein
MTWFTTQEKKVLLFVFSCLFAGILVSRYLKMQPRPKPYPLSKEERILLHKEPININTADFNELVSIIGIGPVLAERILEYRRQHGPFRQINDLRQIKGIGEKKLKEIGKYVVLE